jgi:hypothetical protein
MRSEELHQKSSEGSVVQSDWLPKCHMETGNDSSAAKDFSSQKKVITTNALHQLLFQGTRYKLRE